jgi:hypothetical protein
MFEQFNEKKKEEVFVYVHPKEVMKTKEIMKDNEFF